MTDNSDARNPENQRLIATRPSGRLQMGVEAAKRFTMLYGLAHAFPIYVVTEFPKSGGTWFSQMLSTYLELPFARNHNPQPIRSSILHGVFRYSPLIRRPTVVLRDGRDVMVSAYYHFLHINETNLVSAVEQKRKHLGFRDFDDIHSNLPKFIEYMFGDYAQPIQRCSWSGFMDSWRDRPAAFVRYEELLNDCHGAMSRVIADLTNQPIDNAKLVDVVQQYSWRKLSGRKPGSVKKGSFMRKGIAGDWVNGFSKEAAIAFDQAAGDTLIQWGYEPDHSWVDRLDEPSDSSSNGQQQTDAVNGEPTI